MEGLYRPRLVVAAPQGRSGKTTVTAALIAGLRGRGFDVQPFKKGPDFIDPSWLSLVAGRQCRNLDRFMMDEETIRHSFINHSTASGVAVLEGAMGLFDGVDVDGSGSTAEIAKSLGAPVLLVVNAVRMTRSAAAIVLGCQKFDPDVNVAGVILNNVARPRHRDMLTAVIDRYCNLPVLGVFPKKKEYTVPDRHLGLVPAAENDALQRVLETWQADAESTLDLDRIIEIAQAAPPVESGRGRPPALPTSNVRPRIAVLRDRAFTFYYPENLEALEMVGAELVFVDALHEDLPAGIDALYVGGGFPEMFAAELEANTALRQSVRSRVEAGMPVYAECGGLMYLGERLLWQGESFQMAGAIPFETNLDKKPRGHGYMVLKAVADNPFFPSGTMIKGHEFHHSSVTRVDPGVTFCMEVHRGYGTDGRRDGMLYHNAFAAYCHIHALAVPDWAPNLVRAAVEYHRVHRGSD
ncbi:MAG: cobyrinate a,c-diamide synthase [Clostridia bacterium]|nr:cobyrinate a,c-diamide synthase [Clostridia bacterium]